MDETRAVARLPQLDVEIVHRRLPEADAEELLLRLRATPSFDVFGRHLEAQAPFWPWLVLGPFLLWQQMLQEAWRPWLGTPPTQASGRIAQDG